MRENQEYIAIGRLCIFGAFFSGFWNLFKCQGSACEKIFALISNIFVFLLLSSIICVCINLGWEYIEDKIAKKTNAIVAKRLTALLIVPIVVFIIVTILFFV